MTSNGMSSYLEENDEKFLEIEKSLLQ